MLGQYGLLALLNVLVILEIRPEEDFAPILPLPMGEKIAQVLDWTRKPKFAMEPSLDRLQTLQQTVLTFLVKPQLR